jgi:PIN domain nuclease of toxin-antitoxin system
MYETHRLGKIEADTDELVAAIGQSRFLELPVRAVHAAAAARLPLNHSDPFDRLLVAQAVIEPLRLLTADAVLARYSDLVVLV